MTDNQTQPQTETTDSDSHQLTKTLDQLLRINAAHDLPHLVEGRNGAYFVDAILLTQALETLRQYVNAQDEKRHHFPPTHNRFGTAMGRIFVK